MNRPTDPAPRHLSERCVVTRATGYCNLCDRNAPSAMPGFVPRHRAPKHRREETVLAVWGAA